MPRILPLSALLCCLATLPAFAGQVSLGFEGPGNGPAPADMSEDGYTVTAINMAISSAQKSGDGTDGANEIERHAGTDGYLTISRPLAPFRFVSLDWQAENASPTVLVQGYYGDRLIGTDMFSAERTGGKPTFTTFFADALAGQTLDRLVIHPQRDRAGAGALDAVILEDAAANLSRADAQGQNLS